MYLSLKPCIVNGALRSIFAVPFKLILSVAIIDDDDWHSLPLGGFNIRTLAYDMGGGGCVAA